MSRATPGQPATPAAAATASPLKRKHDEYRDPDYPQATITEHSEGIANECGVISKKRRENESSTASPQQRAQQPDYWERVRGVIEREFLNEITIKQGQLEDIDERLTKAKNLLERLRYAIVAAYYKKLDLPITAADASRIRGDSLFEKEDKGPQMPIHPALKKIMGKKPKDYPDILRSYPKRTAAQNAEQTIRSKSQSQKREEKKLKQLIRDQGIVIDHSKENTTDDKLAAVVGGLQLKTLLNASNVMNDTSAAGVKLEKEATSNINKPAGKALNVSRLNNKCKHMIVVGNTSKFIGSERERDQKNDSGQILTHKWLVYVQAADKCNPLECYVKKVRFYLHHSYRPNDIVDICSPPFQVTRRGWGEFPVRVQLFFHSEYHQKPVQLIHNIVLDQTMSGIQTLGAETLLEIWLRKLAESAPNEIKAKQPVTAVSGKTKNIQTNHTINKPKSPRYIAKAKHLIDDNLLEFLNKIESNPCSISADIEKIQPTILVTEHMAMKLKTPSPLQAQSPINRLPPNPGIAFKIQQKFENSLSQTATEPAEKIVPSTAVAPIFNKSTMSTATANSSNGNLVSKPIMTFVRLPSTIHNKPAAFANSVMSQMQPPPLRPFTTYTQPLVTTSSAISHAKTSIVLNKDGKLMPAASVSSVVRRTILPIVSNKSVAAAGTTTTAGTPALKFTNTLNKPILIQTSSSLSPSSTITHQQHSTLSAPKQILQKKLVQLVDSSGKIKYMQMLVAASSAGNISFSNTSCSLAPKIITMAPSIGKSTIVTTTTTSSNLKTTALQKIPNGTVSNQIVVNSLAGAGILKPNIIKIVPEKMQSKPQIITFNTKKTITGNCDSSTIKIQKLGSGAEIKSLPAATQQMRLAATAVPTNIPTAAKIIKPNGAALMTTKNIVYQKEGKLCVIDPLRMKLKQQQKNQVSLLKPQISLLKQQRAQQSQALPCHKVTPAPPVPPLHYGIKQQRLNALHLMHMHRIRFEKHFLRQEFNNMLSAVEFLMRRLPLIVSKDSVQSAFSFVCYSLQEFHSLTAFKQRACEWLRAKHISRMIRNHKDLQSIDRSGKQLFWSTKEIAIFARQYAYTPQIKSLPRTAAAMQNAENSANFSNLVKKELKQDQQSLQYDTLSRHMRITKWLDKQWDKLKSYEQLLDDNQIIEIVEPEKFTLKTNHSKSLAAHSCTLQPPDAYVSYPEKMENECELVREICQDLSIKLMPEKIDTNTWYPSAQTVLGKCLHTFLEKILRQSLALKQQNCTELGNEGIGGAENLLSQHDIAKVLASAQINNNLQYDFLTNQNFGSVRAGVLEALKTNIKQEQL